MACPWNPADCAGDVVSAGASSALDALVKSIADAVESMLTTVATFWLNVPSPAVDSSAVSVTRLNLEWLVLVMVAAGLLVAMVRMAVTNRLSEAANLGRMYLILTLVTGISTLVVSALLKAGDEMAPWFIRQATGQDFSTSSATLITSAMLTGAGQGAGLVLGLLALLASILQVVAMLLRGAFIIVLMGVLPPLAADTTTESGLFRFKRVMGWLAAAILYKPVAAVIYAAGIIELKDGGVTGATADQTTQSLYSTIEGLIIIILAIVALPALMRFIAPVTQRSGGGPSVAGAVGSVATGAAVVAGVIATGGAAAPAAGAAAGGGTGTATAGGAVGGAAADGGTAGGGAPGGGSGQGPTGADGSDGSDGGGADGAAGGGGSPATDGAGGDTAGGGGGTSAAEGAGGVPDGGTAASGAGGASQVAGTTAKGSGLVASGASGAERTTDDMSGEGTASGASHEGTT
jgi:hypothetical protein